MKREQVLLIALYSNTEVCQENIVSFYNAICKVVMFQGWALKHSCVKLLNVDV